MNSIIKIFLWALGGIAVLALVVIAAFALLFDPNALRDDITRVVADKTGRELVIEGDLSLSFYPWLGFAAGRTTISNAPGFDEPYMARFERASASVRLLPLLSRRVELSQVTLDGVELNLRTRSDGTSNWDDLTALQEAETADASAGDEAGFATEGVGGVRLSDADLSYVDEQAGTSYRVSGLGLETGALQPDRPVGFEARGYLVSVSPGLECPATFTGEIVIGEAGVITVTDAVAAIDATGESIPGDALEMRAEGDRLVLRDDTVEVAAPKLVLNGTGSGDPWNTLDATIEGETLSLTDFDRMTVTAPTLVGTVRSPTVPDGIEARLRGTQLRASVEKETASVDAVGGNLMGLEIQSPAVNATSIFDALSLSARLDIAPFAPRELLAAIGTDDIGTADPQALGSMTLSADARYSPEAVRLQNMLARLDDSEITGQVTYTSAGRLGFDLAVDEVDIDRYRAPSETAAAADAAAGVEEVVIPVEELRALDIDGRLRIGRMQLVGLNSSDVAITIRAAGGDIRVSPARASLYGGTYAGEIRLDVRGEQPVLSLNERVENIQFGPFSKDLLDADRLSGTLSGRLTATGTGASATAITASANGDTEFAFTDGAYEGTNVWYNVRRARAVLEGQQAPAEPEENRTRFADLSGTATIVDGVMRSDDLSMVMPFMRVSGAGDLELLSQQMDFRFRGELVDRPELSADVDDLVGITIPLKVTGAVSAPSVSVDMGAVLADLAKRKLGEKLGLTTEDGEAATPEEVLDEKAQELEDKLKDKLKGLFGGGEG